MPTNLNIDDKLLNKAKRLGKHKTKREAVTVALQEYIRRFTIDELFKLAGKIDYFEDYDYKEARRRRNGAHRHSGVVGNLPKTAARPVGSRTRKAA